MRHLCWWARGAAGLALLLALLAGAAPGAAQTSPAVGGPFRDYYAQHQGLRVLGHPLTEVKTDVGYPMQYFEKGRIEDHRFETQDPNWAFMYGRLTVNLMTDRPDLAVSGSTLTYGQLAAAGDPRFRTDPPPGFQGGTAPVANGATFVPVDSALRPAPGYLVPDYFWRYLTRADLFPGGWLHDSGLPLTAPLRAQVTKPGGVRDIIVQAFERTVLTYDPQNPAGWQVERGNVGADAVFSAPTASPIEVPAGSAPVLLPLHVLAHLGTPGAAVTAAVTWPSGTEVHSDFQLLRDPAGGGLLAGTIAWQAAPVPALPPTGPAVLTVRDAAGTLLARRGLWVVSPDDPATQAIQVFWAVDSAAPDAVQPQTLRVLSTPAIGRAALEELLWGPPVGNPAGFHTALPLPAAVLAFPGRDATWGVRVTLRDLHIANGVATADFSRELGAYGGGSARVAAITAQITKTLQQFPTVAQVVILVNGRADVLQP